jgi:hypothetical protein
LLAFLCKHLAQPVEFFAHLLSPLSGSVAGFDGLKLVERLLGALQSGRFGFHRLLSSGRLHEFVGEFVQCLGQLLLGLLLLGLEAWLVGAAMQRAARPAPKGELSIARGVGRPLVAAIVQSPPGFGPANKRKQSVTDDLNWVMDLFSDLETRDRTGSRSR